MPALGLTDHGVMNGAVEHYKACRPPGSSRSSGSRPTSSTTASDRPQTPRYERNHLTLLAHDDEGFRNLVELSSAGFLEGFSRGKANVDMELLARHSEGVIALTGCLQSRFCRRIVEDRPDDARAHIDDLIQAFGPEQVYFEVQRNGIAEQDKANEGIVRVARELGRPLVATADVHYLRREDYDNHAALLCVQTKSTIEQPKLSFDTNEFYSEEPGGDGRLRSSSARGGREHARDRRALRGRDGARQAPAAALPDARAATEPGEMLRRARRARASRRATATPSPPRPASGSSSSSA